jgi:hypothetical protein
MILFFNKERKAALNRLIDAEIEHERVLKHNIYGKPINPCGGILPSDTVTKLMDNFLIAQKGLQQAINGDFGYEVSHHIFNMLKSYELNGVVDVPK